MSWHNIFSFAAIVLTFVAFVPYYRTIIKGETKPHVFSWFIWAFGTIVVFVAQLSDGAGVGAWPIGLSGLITLGVPFVALANSADRSIVVMDWVFLALASLALPLWLVTETALYAVIILTSVDLLGFGPSVRKAYRYPYEENAMFFLLGAIRNGCVLLALENMSVTTALFPAAIGTACIGFVVYLAWRRQSIRRNQ